MMIGSELKSVDFARLNEICFNPNFKIGPIRVAFSICLGLREAAGQIEVFVKINGEEKFSTPLTNSCRDVFSVGIVTVSVCLSDIQLENGRPAFRVRLQACATFLGRRCIDVLNQVIALGRVSREAILSVKSEIVTLDEALVRSDTDDIDFLYTYPGAPDWSATVSQAATLQVVD